MAPFVARGYGSRSPEARPKRGARRQQATRRGAIDAVSAPFKPGDRVHVYSFGGPNVPRYIGAARIVSEYKARSALYVVRFDDDIVDRIQVVTRSLQGSPLLVLADLKAHWAACVSAALFGDPPLPDSGTGYSGANGAVMSQS